MKGVSIIKGQAPGPTLVIMAGIHGNEKVGLLAFESFKKLSSFVKAGTLYLVCANVDAVEKGVRYIETNMNRSFFSSNSGNTPEDGRAREIMEILKAADALLDIHAFNDAEGEPFAIADRRSLEAASILDVETVTLGWDSIHAGSSDSYMHSLGKIAVCLECGPVDMAHEYAPLALESMKRFLSFFSMSDHAFGRSRKHSVASVSRSIKKKTSNFRFSRRFRNFDTLAKGEVIAVDGDAEYSANEGDIMLFPRPNVPVGGEAAIILRME